MVFLMHMTCGTSSWRFSRSALGRSTGNNVIGHYERHYFFYVVTFSHGRSAQIKNLILRKLMGVPQNLKGEHLSRPRQPFGGPLPAILEFAGGEQVHPAAPLGCFLCYICRYQYG